MSTAAVLVALALVPSGATAHLMTRASPRSGWFGHDAGAGGWEVGSHPRLMGDINGDGRADIVGFGEGGVTVAVSAGGAFLAETFVLSAYGNDGSAGGWDYYDHPRLLGDVNGDGCDDIVAFGENGVQVSRALCGGSVGFTAPALVVSAFGNAASAGGWDPDDHLRLLADVNGDGRVDIVGFGDTGVHVSRGTTAGGFTAPSLTLLAFGHAAGGWDVFDHPRLVGDITGDGCADIVGFGNTGIQVSVANCSGGFSAPVLRATTPVVSSPWTPRFLADVDGDGRLDVVAFDRDGTFTALGRADGTLGPVVLASTDFGQFKGLANNYWSLDAHVRLVGDINGDGRADVVGIRRNSSGDSASLATAVGRTDGRFSSTLSIDNTLGLGQIDTGTAHITDPWSFVDHPTMLRDVNGDGRADLAFFVESGVQVAMGLAGGALFHEPVLALPAFNWGSEHPRAVTDITGDGRADIVGFGETGVQVAVSTGGSGFSGPSVVLGAFGASSSAGGWDVDDHLRLLGNANGDACDDIVAFGELGVQVSLASCTGSFAAPATGVAAFGHAAAAGGWDVVDHPRRLADVNGDGCDDIVGFGETGAQVSIGSCGTSFSAPFLGVAAFGHGSSAGGWSGLQHPRYLADINGDGCDDIVGFGHTGVQVALATCTGTFALPSLPLPGVRSGVLANVNGDAFVDLFVASGSMGSVARGSASGLTAATGSFAITGPGRLYWRVGDINGDDRQDVIDLGCAVPLARGANAYLGHATSGIVAGGVAIEYFGCGGRSWDTLELADIDGNGRSDIVAFEPQGVRVSLAR
jgi:hypothetical protein